jgi:hypothetical protein
MYWFNCENFQDGKTNETKETAIYIYEYFQDGKTNETKETAIYIYMKTSVTLKI